jgi:hypothetical protein
MSLVPLLTATLSLLRAQWSSMRHDDRGMTTETVIITFALATLALIVVGIIATKMTGKANDIPVD